MLSEPYHIRSTELADNKQKKVKPRYRVTDVRPYIKFGQLRIETGNIIPKKVRVEDWLVDAGWVEEVI